MIKRAKRISVLVLAATLACSMLVLPEAYAANSVDVGAECSIQVNCNEQYEYDASKAPVKLDENKDYDEVGTSNVAVKLYKVATIDVTGNYTAENTFRNVIVFKDVEGKERTFEEWLSPAPAERDKYSLSSETPAGDWADVAVALNSALSESSTPTASGNSSQVISGLETGLYLIVADKLVNEGSNSRYEFVPYLVSLPNNYYSESNNNDAWDYDLIDGDKSDEGVTGTTNHAIGLKPAMYERYGYLAIKKNLNNYSGEGSGAVFVYKITATKDDEPVYNDVVAIDFAEPGNKTVLVGPIKAGASVMVEEVYTGAAYEQTSTNPEPVVIVPETYFDNCKTEDEAKIAARSMTEDDFQKILNEVTVEFSNQHNGLPNGGSGVVNEFKDMGESWGASQDYQGQEEWLAPEY